MPAPPSCFVFTAPGKTERENGFTAGGKEDIFRKTDFFQIKDNIL
jgi:hypothetical protein